MVIMCNFLVGLLVWMYVVFGCVDGEIVWFEGVFLYFFVVMVGFWLIVLEIVFVFGYCVEGVIDILFVVM